MTEWEDAEKLEWSRFHGSISQFIGETLTFEQSGERFELTFDGSLLGLLSRPDDAYLAETEDGSWRFTHPGLGFKRVEIEDVPSGAFRAEYTRRLVGSGGDLLMGAGTRYRLRRDGHPLWVLSSGGQPWNVTGPDGAEIAKFELNPGDHRIRIRPLTETAPSNDLPLLILLSAYVLVVDAESRSTGASGGPGP